MGWCRALHSSRRGRLKCNSFSWVGICYDLGNRLQETQPDQILRGSPSLGLPLLGPQPRVGYKAAKFPSRLSPKRNCGPEGVNECNHLFCFSGFFYSLRESNASDAGLHSAWHLVVWSHNTSMEPPRFPISIRDSYPA